MKAPMTENDPPSHAKRASGSFTAVVIVTKSAAEGYSMCFAGSMISSIYRSNQAKRDQMRGRINRLSQSRKSVEYVTIHGGVLTYIHKKHLTAASIAALVNHLAQAVGILH
jgi:hypothetical protein